MYTHIIPHRQKQVASIQLEFESYQHRGIYHPNLVQYLTMTHSFMSNKIKVEVCTSVCVCVCVCVCV